MITISACDPNCKSCFYSKPNGLVCNSCKEGYFKDISSSKPTCILCTSKMSACKTCSDEKTCTKCLSTEYTLADQNQCIACNTISDCEECHKQSGLLTCTKCKAGYRVTSGSCSVCPLNCDSCTQTTGSLTCNKCKANYTVLKQFSCDACPRNCLRCQVENDRVQCKFGSCEKGYTLTNDKLCSKCPDNCLDCTYNNNEERTECKGTAESHSCSESSSGQSWTRKSDGTCARKF